MKVVGGFYLWGMIALRFFRHTARLRQNDLDRRRDGDRLTYSDVAQAFDAAGEPPRESEIEST